MDTFLTGRRAAQNGFIEPAFPTIAGSGPHGAIIHYRAEPETCGTVSASKLLLVDSGAHLPLPVYCRPFRCFSLYQTLCVELVKNFSLYHHRWPVRLRHH